MDLVENALPAGDGNAAERPAELRRGGVPIKVLALYVAVAAALILLVTLPFASDYVGEDNDDVMRLVSVRDLLAGQGWFDTTQYRLGLEGGTLMHWSRLVDLPIANLIEVFSFFAPPATAEALALTVWPLLLLVPLFVGMGFAGLRLGGKAAMHASLVLTLILVVSINRFQPGAIDHHNLQLVFAALLAAMLLDPDHGAASYAAAGLLSALALAIGAETTPLVAVVCLVAALRWAWHGAAFARAASAFGLSLAASSTLAFFITVPPSRYGAVTCDNLSYGFYALATFGGGTLFLAAATASRHARFARFGALAACAVVLAAAVLAVAPHCLRNPLADLDPLLKVFWLSGVTEAQSIAAQAGHDPGSLGGFYAPGLLALAVCLWRTVRRDQREAHLVLLALIGCALAVAMVQVRGAVFANLLSALPLGLAIVDLRRRAHAAPDDLSRGLAFAAMTIAAVPSAWALAGLALPGTARERLDASLENAAAAAPIPACDSRAAIAPLAAEPEGVVAGPSDLGAAILRFTGHRVLSAPYHRNQGGMLTELHIGLSNPRQAEAFLRGAGVTLVAFCPTNYQVHGIARAEPEGLYANLLAGRVPPYLERIARETPSLRIYRVRAR